MAVLKALLTGRVSGFGLSRNHQFFFILQIAGSINWGAKKYYTGSGYATSIKEDAEKFQSGSA